jgi:selenide,water dikinase
LEWVTPHIELSGVDDLEALLLADAQTSGGLLVAGEVRGYPVIGEFGPAAGGITIVVR